MGGEGVKTKGVFRGVPGLSCEVCSFARHMSHPDSRSRAWHVKESCGTLVSPLPVRKQTSLSRVALTRSMSRVFGEGSQPTDSSSLPMCRRGLGWATRSSPVSPYVYTCVGGS